MNVLDARIPPAVAAGAVALLMRLGSRAFPCVALPMALRAAVGLVPAAAGLGLVAGAVASFRRARTTLSPLRPAAASTLVVSGVYRFTRNPMYLGVLLMLVGWAAFLGSPPALALSAVFVLYVNRFQILPEERAMLAVFGSEYAAYKAKVRRWL